MSMFDPESLRAWLRTHAPVDERERVSVALFLAELDRLPTPFLEDVDPFHVTSSAIVVGPRGVILHKHKRLGIWIQPGGHIDPGEAPEDAVLREVFEETGLAGAHPPTGPRLIHVDVHPAPKGHTHLDLRFLVIGPDADPNPGADESPDVAWVPLHAAVALADPGLSGLLTALADGRYN